jgi:expansin (peptidoglycan-binding protein)
VGNVAVRFKEAGNVYWNEFLVENHRNPIAKFEALLSGTYVTAVRKAYNYFSANEGNIKSNDWPLVVRITDIHGSVIAGAIPKPSGSPRIDFGVQFPACAQ